jgi:hypothetical protein
MNDMAYCSAALRGGGLCPIRESCLRHTMEKDEWQWHVEAMWKEERLGELNCENYVGNGR